MRRISGPTVATDLFGAGKHGFKNGNKALGVAPTDLNAEIFNTNQEELCNVIEGVGMTIDPEDDTQLLQALRIILSNADMAVRFTTTAAIVLNGLAVQAGGDWAAPLTADNFILVKNQAAASANGWYQAKAGAWTRIVYLDESAEVKPSLLTKVSEGATLADSLWMLTTDAPIVLNTTALTFERKDKTEAGVKAGTIIYWPGTTAPDGYMALPSVATNISRATFSEVFANISTAWGVGDGATTFGCPFCPGNYALVAGNAGNVGTQTVGEVIAHTHTIQTTTPSGSTAAGSSAYTNTTGPSGSTGGSANLPAGVRMLACMKLRNS